MGEGSQGFGCPRFCIGVVSGVLGGAEFFVVGGMFCVRLAGVADFVSG